jgi:type III restriction enzyme
MELKPYQTEALDTFDRYLAALTADRAKALIASEVLRQHPELELPNPDFPAKAWSTLRNSGQLPHRRTAHQYNPRVDGIGNPLPSVCLKVPTGGGKTLLGAHAVSRIMGKYIESNTGFVLWIVPNEAIYTQTKKQLTNRESALRQVLDRAAAGRVKVLEKDDPLNALDVQSNLCVMLLMLQSANRVTKETLRLFRDRGNVHGFFPAEDDVLAHIDLATSIPNLDRYLNVTTAETAIKDSLGNVLRLLRPVVVIDEGQKAYTANALATISGFNPSFVLELSATPKDDANWLVDVGGLALQSAEMVKFPINVKIKEGDDWKDCLRESLDQLNKLQRSAETLRDETSLYIRPILLVQVERTGKDARDTSFIHAEDAREFLLSLGLDRPQIAIKTADTNELDTPENSNLLSPTCPVRVVITKQALQEGWDCPFAYVLCTLATNRNESALTQLIGRILRQPYTKYLPDRFKALNQSYVFCHQAKTESVVQSIKKGLESDGLGELTGQVRSTGTDGEGKPLRRKLARRESFRNLTIYLPTVNWVEGSAARPLDYESDVLYRIDWDKLDLAPLVEKLINAPDERSSYVMQIDLATGKDWLKRTEAQHIHESPRLDTVYATRILVDVVPNPWVARAIISDLLVRLQQQGLTTETIAGMSGFIIEEMRKWSITQRDRLAEQLFLEDVANERVQFRLRADRQMWKLPGTLDTDLPETSQQLRGRSDGAAISKSVFAPVYERDYNPSESAFACYLDEQSAVEWWHRNVARPGQYHLQGWQKNRVYPDFIFGLHKQGKKRRLLVWETKGDHLAGDPGSVYKKHLLDTMTECFRNESVVRAGELELVAEDGTTVACEMVMMADWRSKLIATLAPA